MNEPSARRYFRIALGAVAAVTAVRILLLTLSPLELYPDEAQYWWWAQSLDVGYFSKPPMIAWIIRGTTALLGDSEWAIRFGAPLLHGLTALVVYAIGRFAFDSRIGLIGALAYTTAPGVAYSASLISSDIPLLLCWSVALLAFLRALDDEGWRWPIVCGIAVGLGLLSKYAMLYFLLGAAAAVLIDPRARAFVLGPRGATAIAIALVIFAPNVWWNAQHGYPTMANAEADADWSEANFNPLTVLRFVLGQFGVFGPILMAALLAALWRLARSAIRSRTELVLAGFCAPPLALMIVQSFIVSANANWAATAYISAFPLVANELGRWWHGRALWMSFAINGAAMLVLWSVLLDPFVADELGLGNAFKRQEGWWVLGRRVVQAATHDKFDSVASDNRSLTAELLYYARPLPVPIKAWSPTPRPHNHFQMTMPLRIPARRVLLVLTPQNARAMTSAFDSAALVGDVVVSVGGHHPRVTELYDARGFHGP